MQYSFTLLALVAATTVIAAPLNINMGAYSPALVVGDGAIGFKGTESVTNLMNTLQGAAASSAAVSLPVLSHRTILTFQKANGAAVPAAAAPAAASAVPITQAEPQGMGKNINSLPVVTRADQEGATLTPEEIEILEDAADEAAVAKRTQIPNGAVLTDEEIELLEDETDAVSIARRALDDGAVLTAEEIEILEDAEEEGTMKTKRQSAGFSAALAYASA